MVRMGQEWQGSSARRRSLESAMKETQARTKVVLRHLPPSLSSSALHDQIVSKYAGTITWFAFHPGKSRWASFFPLAFGRWIVFSAWISVGLACEGRVSRCYFVSSCLLVSCLGCRIKRVRFFFFFFPPSLRNFHLSVAIMGIRCMCPSLSFSVSDFQLGFVLPLCHEEWIGSPLVTKRLGKITNLALHTLKHLDWDTRRGFSVEFPVPWWWLETAFS